MTQRRIHHINAKRRGLPGTGGTFAWATGGNHWSEQGLGFNIGFHDIDCLRFGDTTLG
jgi:hypothetical protein